MNLSAPAETGIAPRPDKALVYFIRPKSAGYGVHAAVYDGETFIGMVPYKQKLPYEAEPGEHLFMVVSEAADFLRANLVAGKTYYVQVVPRMGAWRARFSLAPVTKEELASSSVRKRIAKARLIRNKEAAVQWASNNHTSVLHKKEEYFKSWVRKDDEDKPTLNPDDCE